MCAVIARKGVSRQYGVTLLECLIAVAMGALILTGTASLLTIALQANDDRSDPTPHDRARQVMDRIVWAMETATRLKKSELPLQNDTTKSGLWFDRIDPDTGKKVEIEYRWDVGTSVLRERNAETGLDSGILTNVSNFSVTAPDNTHAAVVTVSLTFGNPPDQITLVEKRRLGGAW